MSTVQPEKVGFDSTRLTRIDTILQRYIERGQLAGMVATVARHGQTAYQAKFGLADREAEQPMTYDTIFRIASMTKPVTSVAAMMLYEEGYFNLNTPISEFIPAFKEVNVVTGTAENGINLTQPEQEITMRHLFTHTAGLSYGGDENDPVDKLYQEAFENFKRSGRPISMKEVVDELAQMPLAFQPGSR